MSGDLAWPIRPKWHRYESPRSYATRQCEASGMPVDFVERRLTTPSQQYLKRVWADQLAAGAIVEVAAGRPVGHFARLKSLAQPDPYGEYPRRYLCRLCAAGESIEQVPHDRENWCLKHSGVMVWAGVGTSPGSQLIFPFDRKQARAERQFRRIASQAWSSPFSYAGLHARVWEMVRDNASLAKRDSHSSTPIYRARDREILGRASLYPATVSVLKVLSDAATVTGWLKLPPEALRGAIAADLPPIDDPVDILIERIVLWLRKDRRKDKRTRCATLFRALDDVDAAAIIDVTAPYPSWIRHNPAAIAEWAWPLCDPRTDPWDGQRISQTAVWACFDGHVWKASPSVRGLSGSGCPYCAGQKAWPGHTDLRTTHPRIAAEWGGVRRNAGDPDHVAATSNRRIHWRCRRGHRWQATIRARALEGAGCPYCDGTRTLEG